MCQHVGQTGGVKIFWCSKLQQVKKSWGEKNIFVWAQRWVAGCINTRDYQNQVQFVRHLTWDVGPNARGRWQKRAVKVSVRADTCPGALQQSGILHQCREPILRVWNGHNMCALHKHEHEHQILHGSRAWPSWRFWGHRVGRSTTNSQPDRGQCNRQIYTNISIYAYMYVSLHAFIVHLKAVHTVAVAPFQPR